MFSWQTRTTSPEATEELAMRLGALLPAGTLIRLEGDLGAGKTCLTRGLARGLEVPADEPVTSPTYTLLNQYQGRLPLHHFDLYRLQGGEDLFEIGLEECCASPGVTVLEWAERAEGVVQGGLRIELVYCDETSRHLTLSTDEPTLEPLLQQLAASWDKGEAV